MGLISVIGRWGAAVAFASVDECFQRFMDRFVERWCFEFREDIYRDSISALRCLDCGVINHVHADGNGDR